MKKKILFCMFFCLFLLVGFFVLDFDYKVITNNVDSIVYEAGSYDGELSVGTYTSYDNHTITVNEDGTVLYDNTYSLTVTASDKGYTLNGKIGTNKKSVTFYQVNDSSVISNATVNYTHNDTTVYLYDYTGFKLNVTPVVNSEGVFELYHDGAKVNSYTDLQSAIDAASNGDTVKITEDYKVTSGAYINKNLTIDGENHTLNRSEWANAFLVVEEGCTLNLKNITIDGGADGFEVARDENSGMNIPLKSGSDANDPKQNLSVIISKGNLIIDKVNVNNNYVSGNGAAINVVSGKLILNNSNFNHNRASKGGSISIGSNFKQNQTKYPVQDVVLDNTIFESNYSSNAGCIYVYNTNNITIKNSKFLNNTVTGGKGGGIFFDYQRSTDRKNYHSIGKQLGLKHTQVELDNCTFDGNWVGNDGFAIENQGAEMLITNSIFKNNKGMDMLGSMATISNMGDEVEYYDVTIKNSIFEKNEGGCSGVADHATLLNLVVEDTKFIENKGWYTIFLYSGDAVIKKCEFIKDKVSQAVIVTSTYSNSGTPNFHKPVMVLEDSTFTDTVNGSAAIQLRKYSRKIANNSLTLYLKGNTNGVVHVWDNNKLIVSGNHTGNIYVDSFTSTDEGITISDNGKVNGNVFYNKDKYTYTLIFFGIDDGYEYRRYLYLDKDKTYNQREFFMKHFLSEDGYMLEYYTDSSFTNKWDYTASVTNNKATIYGKWVEHNHTYDGYTILYDNTIYEQCECGYLGKKLYLSAPDDLYYDGNEKEVVVNNEIGVSGYTLKYQVQDDDGNFVDIVGVPVKIGTYKVILTYNGLDLSMEYSILEQVSNPNTGVYSPYIICGLLVGISVIGFVLTKNKKFI